MRQTTPIEKILGTRIDRSPIDQIIKTQIEQQKILDRLQLQSLQPAPSCSPPVQCSPHGIGYPMERAWQSEFLRRPVADTSTCSTCTMKMTWMQRLLYLAIGALLGVTVSLLLKRRR
jgi:hypothetical protein